jgi:hypothetical protein
MDYESRSRRALAPPRIAFAILIASVFLMLALDVLDDSESGRPSFCMGDGCQAWYCSLLVELKQSADLCRSGRQRSKSNINQ